MRIALKTACTENCSISYRFFFTVYFFLWKEYKKDLGTEIIGKGMQVGPYIPEIQWVKKASEEANQVDTVKS